MTRYWGFPPAEGKAFFISYNSEDWKRAALIAKALNDMGYPVWYDQGLEAGTTPWQTQISKSIENCYAGIVFITNGIFKKKECFVINEYALAKDENKPVIPVFLDSFEPAEVPTGYKLFITDCKTKQCLPFRKETAQETAKRIADAIEHSHDIDFKLGSEAVKKYGIGQTRKKIGKNAAAVMAAALAVLAAVVSGYIFWPRDPGIEGYGEPTPTPENYYIYNEASATDVKALSYKETEDGEGYIVTGYNKYSDIAELVLPRTHEGKPVVAIGDEVFVDANNLVSLTIPDTVTKIGKHSVSFCNNLETCLIPDSITSVGEGSFYHCGSLKTLRIPPALDKDLEDLDYAFSACGTEILYVDGKDQKYCSYDGNVYSRNMETLVRYACGKENTEYILPEKIRTVSPDAFACAQNLTDISVNESNSNYSSYEGVLFNKKMDRLIAYPAGKKEEEYIVPHEAPCIVEVIGPSAFSSNEHLETIIVNEGVKKIGRRAFSYVKYMEKLEIPDSVTEIEDLAIASNHNLETVKLPAKLNKIPDGLFTDCRKLDTVKTDINDQDGVVRIPDNVKSIGEGAFMSCHAIKKLDIPGNVKTIDVNAFRSCESLEETVIPASVKSIGESAFVKCSKLESLTFEDGIAIDSIPDSMCCFCTALDKVSIPSSVKRIEKDAFRYCGEIEITAPNDPEYYGYSPDKGVKWNTKK